MEGLFYGGIIATALGLTAAILGLWKAYQRSRASATAARLGLSDDDGYELRRGCLCCRGSGDATASRGPSFDLPTEWTGGIQSGDGHYGNYMDDDPHTEAFLKGSNVTSHDGGN